MSATPMDLGACADFAPPTRFAMLRDLLDERLEWPVHQRHHGGPWRLGHGLAVVGPGWWPLVRRAYAAVAETPGAMVANVCQKCAVLEVRLQHPDRGTHDRLYALALELTEASRSRFEVCGVAVPPVDPERDLWRTHCPRCRSRLVALAADGHAERRLWEERAGKSWPWSEW